MYDYTNKPAKKLITGNDEEIIKLLSIEKNIDSSYPPTFVWTTKEDEDLSYMHSEMYAKSLEDANVIHEYFLYPYLGHGRAIITPLLYPKETLQEEKMQGLSIWFSKSIDFINKVLKK
jgi:acetyl esterase/lipase